MSSLLKIYLCLVCFQKISIKKYVQHQRCFLFYVLIWSILQRNFTNLKLEWRKRQVSSVVQFSNYRVLYYSTLCNFGYSYTVHTLRFYNEKNVFFIKFCAENFIISIFCSHLFYFVYFDKKFVWGADCTNDYHVVQYKIKRPLYLHM